MQVIERKACSLSAKSAALASALHSTGASAEAHQILADTAAELGKASMRGRGLQAALVPLLSSALTLCASTESSCGTGSRPSDVAGVIGSFWRRSDQRAADDSWLEACARALADLLRDGDGSVLEAAARCAMLWLLMHPLAL